jgi:methyltransferase (TIGR00027 family)
VGDDHAPGANSETAYWIAAARARESERDDRLFSDPYASVFAGALGRNALEASARASGGDNEFLVIRTRFFDDVLGDEAAWLDQVVLLGAGFDTRAYRLDLPDQLRWFEIDVPEILEEKERVLSQLGPVARCQRFAVTADISGAWGESLLDAGFSIDCRTASIAEGLLFYLSSPVVARVLAEARRLSGGGSLIGADVMGSGLLTLPSMRPSLSTRTELGLPPPFTTDDPAALFRAAGWPLVQLAFPGQLGAAYGRPFHRADQGPEPPDPTMQSYLVVGRNAR